MVQGCSTLFKMVQDGSRLLRATGWVQMVVCEKTSIYGVYLSRFNVFGEAYFNTEMEGEVRSLRWFKVVQDCSRLFKVVDGITILNYIELY
jgi:hypothetical protein